MKSEHTFVVCAYKESRYLEECVLSLLGQKFPSEVVVYTSTPNETIQSVVDKYNLKLFTAEGSGIGIDWNRSLSVAQTKYVTIAHQDDIYDKNYSEKILKAFKNDSHTLIAFSNYQELRNGTVIRRGLNLKVKDMLLRPIQWFPKSKKARNFALSFGNGICCPAVSYNKELLKDFKFDETMRTSLDWEGWYRIAQMKGSFAYLPESLMYHRIHEESETTHTIADNSRMKEDREMFEKYWPKWFVNILMHLYVKSQDSNTL